MDKSRFDETIMKFLTKRRSRGGSRESAVTVASKLLEISYAMGEVEREIEERRSVIFDNLRRHESMSTIVGGLRSCSDELADFQNGLRDFEAVIRPRIDRIERARNAFLDELRDADEDEGNQAELAQQLGVIVREMNHMRDDLVAEINTVEQRVAILVTEIEDTMALINLKNKQNAAFYERMERKHSDLLRRRRELTAKLDELSASRELEQVRDGFDD